MSDAPLPLPGPPGRRGARGLEGLRAVVTAGGTREPLDPIRFIGNRSSGKMGGALVRACLEAGAQVELVTAAPPPTAAPGLSVTEVETAAQMHRAVWAALDTADLLLMAAAVADYRPREVSPRKLKKSAAPMAVELVPTVDILASVRDHPRRSRLLVVGFAAETDDLIANATSKLRAKGLDLVVLNDVGAPGVGMGAEDNAITVLDGGGVVLSVARAPKLEVARKLVALLAARLRGSFQLSPSAPTR